MTFSLSAIFHCKPVASWVRSHHAQLALRPARCFVPPFVKILRVSQPLMRKINMPLLSKTRDKTALIVGVMLCNVVQAQTLTIGTGVVNQGDESVEIPVSFDATGTPVGSYSLSFTFERPPAAPSGLVSFVTGKASCGGPATIDATATALNVGAFDPKLGPLPTALACTFAIPLDSTASVGSYPFEVTFSEFGDLTGLGTVQGTIVAGGIVIQPRPNDIPPALAYNPTTASTVVLESGAGSIEATPFGGMGSGAAATTAINGCAIGGVSGPGTFGSVAGVNLTFVGNTTSPQSINLSCTLGDAVTTGTLTCNETAGSGPPLVRSWSLTCPSSSLGVPPNLTYVPSFGSNVSFIGTPGTQIISTISVIGISGTGSGGSATARVSDCQVSPALSPPVFACQPSGGNVLDFTPGGADPGDITCSCEAPSTGQLTANLTCEETRPLGTTPVVRQWSLTCPGTPGSCGTLVFSPNPGLIQFTGGTASIGISHTGGTMGNDTTFNGCGITGANASNFQISNAPINFSFTGGSTGSGQIDLACTNSTTAPVQATLSCSQVCDVNNTPRTWTLECPAGGTPPPTAEVVPVPSSSDFSRILLAAMLVLIGMAAVTIRGRS